MGFFDDLFSSEGEKPIAKITGRHISGLNLNNEAEITVQLFQDRIVFKSDSTYLAESDIDDILFVDGRYEDVNTGSVTTSREETNFASSLALMNGDWGAYHFLKPNKTIHETKHTIERHFYLVVDTFKNNVALQVDDQDDLIDFVNECNNIIDNYESVDEDLAEETSKKDEPQTILFDAMTDKMFEQFCEVYLNDNGFTNVVLLPKSIDGRVTIVAEKDEVKYAIRCVNYSTNEVAADIINEIESGRKHYRCHVGLVMSASVFSKEAKKTAEDNIILLWDKEKLKQINDFTLFVRRLR